MIKLNLQITLLKIFGSAFLFLAIYILSKKMSFYEYGIYETVVRITLLISIFSLYGIPVLITRAKNLYSSKKIFLSTLSTVFTINAILILISISIIYFFANNYVSVIPIIISGLFYAIYKMSGNLSLKNKKYFVSILSDDSLFNILLAIFLMISLIINLKLTLLSVSVIVLICRIITFFILNSSFKIKILKLKNKFSYFKESTTIFKQSFSQKLVNNLPVVMCPFLFSGDETGIFALSTRLSLIYMILLSGFNIYITPNISEKINQKKFKNIILKSVLFFSLLGFLIFIFNLFFSKYLEFIWDEFKNYSHIYVIILAGYLVNLSTGSAGVILNHIGLENKHLKVNLISLSLLLFSFIVTYFSKSLLFFSISVSLIVATENILKFKYIKPSLT